MSSRDTCVSYQGSIEHSSCGYCKSNNACSFFLSVESLSVQHYQCLVDRGWRRSGNTLYKPHMALTCCKHYTIRMNSASFKPSRDQRQTLHKWTRYVLGDEYIREAAKKNPKSKLEKKQLNNTFSLAASVHAPEYSTVSALTPPSPAHKLEITLEPASYTDEKFALFANYQQAVHHETTTPTSFKRFLCSSPIFTSTEGGKRLGSFHQLYRLDGRLIALSVLDLLPSAVSAVYFVYHSDFEKWQLGKVSVMREALLTSEEGYGWYYMGYYIPTCRKMRYKGEYKPQEVLRPADNVFVPLEGEVKRALDEEGKLGQEEGKAGQEVKDGQEEENDTEIKGLDGNADDDKSGEDGEVEELDGTADEDESEDEGGLLGPGFLFKSQMPGVMAQKELDAFDLGEVKIRVGRKDAVAKYLVGFEKEDSIPRMLIKETVAAVGKEVAKDMVVVLY